MYPNAAPIRADEPYSEETGAAAPQGPGDLHNTFNRRALFHGAKHQLQDELIKVYNGILPPKYDDFFPEEIARHVPNFVRLAWDDHAAFAGQEFPIYFPAENDTPAARERAEKRETICYGFNSAGRKAGGIDMRGLSYVLAHQLVGCAEAVMTVLPDYRRKTSMFGYRDVRHHFAPIGWSPWEDTDLNGTLFAYRANLAYLMEKYEHCAAELSRAYTKQTTGLGKMSTGWKGGFGIDRYDGKSDNAENIWVWCAEYYNEDAWYFSTLEDRSVTILSSEQGLDRSHPGIVPVVGMSVYNPESPRSNLADQVSMQAAFARMFSLQLEFYEATLEPMIFSTPLAHKDVRRGPNGINWFRENETNPKVEVVGPTSVVSSEHQQMFIMGLMRMLNRDPESLQGGGDANSAKALNALQSRVTSNAQATYWPTQFQAFPQAYSKAMHLVQNLWKDEPLRISGRTPKYHSTKRDMPVATSYRPIRDLEGFEDECEIEPGILLRGYEGRMETMQLVASELMSEETAREQLDVVRDPHQEGQRVQADRIRKVNFADFAAAVQLGPNPGGLQPGALAEILERTEKGEDFNSVVIDLDRASRYKIPLPEPVPAGGPGAEGLPGGPGPDMAALGASIAGGLPMEGGGVPLELLQGAG